MPTAPSADSSPALVTPPQLADASSIPLSHELLQDVASTFGLLSATVRLHILWLLASGERDVGSLAEEIGQSVPTISHHLAKLKLAGLVHNRREGKRQVYLVDDAHVVDLVELAVRHHSHQYRTRRRRRSAG